MIGRKTPLTNIKKYGYLRLHPRSLLFQREPDWRAASLPHPATAPRSWLNEPASLTARLRRAAGGGFGVRLIGQGLGKPFIGESRLLGLSARRRALTREVLLFSQAEPLVLARTVIPALALRGEHCALARLGNRPLGEVLFAQRDLRRTSLAFSQVYPADWLGSIAQDYSITQPVWGRRSLYQIGEVSLLVSEFFLAAVLSLEEY